MISITGSDKKLSLRELEAKAVEEIKLIMANRGAKYSSRELAGNVIGLESLRDNNESEFNNTKGVLIELMSELERNTNISELIKRQTTDPAKRSFALEAMALTMLTGQNLSAAYKASSAKSLQDSRFITIAPNDGTNSYSIESFEETKSAQYLAATAVANSQAAIPGNFEETWFPQIMIPAGQSGYDVVVTVPKVLVSNLRNIALDASGSAAFSMKKVSLLEAVYDPSILNSLATAIVPNPGWNSGAFTAVLAPTAGGSSAVPTLASGQTALQTTVAGNVVNTLPILFNTSVDLIAISNNQLLLSNGALDVTDALDPVVNIGSIIYGLQITSGGGAPVVAGVIASQDISNQVGALLTQKPQGAVQSLQTVMTGYLYFSGGYTSAANLNSPVLTAGGGSSASTQFGASAVAFAAQAESAWGITGGAGFTLVFSIQLSAEANTETGNMIVTIGGTPKLVQVQDSAGNPYPIATSGTYAWTLVPIGFLPKARRTNSNLRVNGTIIDPNTTVNYRLPIQLSAPFTSQAPINSNNNMPLEGLGHTTRLWIHGLCVTALTNMEAFLQTAWNLPMVVNTNSLGSSNYFYEYQSPIMGGEFVIPYYITSKIDVAAMTTSLNSMDNLTNLRGALTSALTNLSSALAFYSGYIRALQMVIGDIDAYEVIVVTDPNIAIHLMEAGDTRTIGDNRSYVITKSNHKDIVGKMYFSFRMKGNTDEVHPLNFGTKLFSPALTYEVQMFRQGRVNNEIQTIPRVNVYANLPVLGVINVVNLNTMYTTSSSVLIP